MEPPFLSEIFGKEASCGSGFHKDFSLVVVWPLAYIFWLTTT